MTRDELHANLTPGLLNDPRDFADGLRRMGIDLPEGSEAWICGIDWGTGEAIFVEQEVLIGQVQEFDHEGTDVPSHKVYEMSPSCPENFVSGRKVGTVQVTEAYYSPRLGLLYMANLFEDWWYR